MDYIINVLDFAGHWDLFCIYANNIIVVVGNQPQAVWKIWAWFCFNKIINIVPIQIKLKDPKT